MTLPCASRPRATTRPRRVRRAAAAAVRRRVLHGAGDLLARARHRAADLCVAPVAAVLTRGAGGSRRAVDARRAVGAGQAVQAVGAVRAVGAGRAAGAGCASRTRAAGRTRRTALTRRTCRTRRACGTCRPRGAAGAQVAGDQAVEDGEDVRLIDRPLDVRRLRARRPDGHLGAGVGLRAGRRVGRAVADAHRRAVDRLHRGVARAGGRHLPRVDDLRGVCVVGRDDDQRVGVVGLEVERLADGVVELEQLADLTADVGRVIALVDRRALDLQDEALVIVVEQLDRLLGHRRQRRLVGRAIVLRAARRRRARARGRRQQHSELGRHVAGVKQAQQLRAAGQRGERVHAGLVADDGVAVALRVVDDRRRAGGGQRLLVAGTAAAEVDVEVLVDLLLGDRSEPWRRCRLGLRRTGRPRIRRSLARALRDMRARACRRRVGELRGRDVAGGLALVAGDLHVGAVSGVAAGDVRGGRRPL